MKPKQYAAIVFAVLLAVTWFIDSTVREAHTSSVRAEMASEAEAIARDLSDLMARETAAVNTLAAFVDITSHHDGDISAQFDVFAAPLLQAGDTIQSVQLAPNAIIKFVYPLEGNEEAMNLALLADPDRRAILLPAIETGSTVVQGPVELVQGGVGVLVRKPIFNDDGTFFGFAAILLNWDSVIAETGLEEMSADRILGTRVADTGRVIAGDPAAFEQDPEVATLKVGSTETTWEVALRPPQGWPTTAPATPYIWLGGLMIATFAALFTHSLAKRPEILRREREKAVKELAFAEARYRATVRHAAVGVMMSDTTGKIVSANPAMYRIAGRPEDGSLKGTIASELVHDSDQAKLAAWGARLRNKSQAEEREIRLKGHADRWARVIVTRIEGTRDDDMFVSIVEDITSRREAERSLAESEARFRQLFEQAPIAIQREDYSEAVAEFERLHNSGVDDIRAYLTDSPEILRDLLGKVRIIDANPASERLQGHLAESDGQLTLLDRLSEPAHATFLETLVAVSEGRSSLEQSVETIGDDGTPLYLDVRWSAPMVDDEPDYSRIMVTISDITELREAQQRLETLIESKDRFVASVAHELRTPLTAVVGFAQELKDELQMYSEREKDEFRELIALHSSELSDIIEDLLVWARGDIGEVKVNPERIDLGDSVRASLTAVNGLLAPVAEPDGPIVAVADPARIRQIVRNLATNALRYGGDDIDIQVRRMNGSAVIDVSDDGPALRDTKRIFEPYARSDASLVAPGSIGLGLSVSRSLARIQGGDLTMVRENGRNVFRVVLPLAEDQALVDV